MTKNLTYNCLKIEQLVILGLRFHFGIQCPRFLETQKSNKQKTPKIFSLETLDFNPRDFSFIFLIKFSINLNLHFNLSFL